MARRDGCRFPRSMRSPEGGSGWDFHVCTSVSPRCDRSVCVHIAMVMAVAGHGPVAHEVMPIPSRLENEHTARDRSIGASGMLIGPGGQATSLDWLVLLSSWIASGDSMPARTRAATHRSRRRTGTRRRDRTVPENGKLPTVPTAGQSPPTPPSWRSPVRLWRPGRGLPILRLIDCS